MGTNRKKAGLTVIGIILVLYCLITLFPFYLLAIRTFVPTKDSTNLHLWIPKKETFNLEFQMGNLSTYYNLDMKKVKKDLGLKGYINPYITIRQIAESNNIPLQKITEYFQPFVLYNGWISIINNQKFYVALFGSVFVSVASIILGGILGILTGSVLAGLRRRWHGFVFNSYLLSMVIPPVAIMIPTFIIIKQFLKLDDSLFILVLLNIKGESLSVMVFTTFISTIPREIKESVEIDGGNRLNYLFSIVFPLCTLPLGVFTSIRLPFFWNELLNGLLFLKPEQFTLMPFINSFSQSYATNFQAIYSGMLLTLMPLVFLYIVFRKLFIASVLSGAIKG